MHERDEANFKLQYAASYLATRAAQLPPSDHDDVNRLFPVAMADWLADGAWVRWVKVNAVDRTLVEPVIHCCRDMDADVTASNQNREALSYDDSNSSRD